MNSVNPYESPTGPELTPKLPIAWRDGAALLSFTLASIIPAYTIGVVANVIPGWLYLVVPDVRILLGLAMGAVPLAFFGLRSRFRFFALLAIIFGGVISAIALFNFVSG